MVPSVQKKTGPVAKDVDENGEEVETKKAGKKRKATPKEESEGEDQEVESKPAAVPIRGKKAAPKEVPKDEDEGPASKPAAKKGRGKKAAPKSEEGSDEKPVVDEAHEEEADSEAEIKPVSKKQKSVKNGETAKAPKTKKAKSAGLKEEPEGRRKSGRARAKEVSYAED